MSDLVHLDVDVVGQTGKRYTGSFTLKKYLNQRDRNEVARITNKLTIGMRHPPTYSVQAMFDMVTSALQNHLAKVLQDQQVNEKYGDSLSPRTLAVVAVDAALSEIKDVDQRYYEMLYLATINVHIQDSPDWWKPKGAEIGGLDLEDFEPIAQLNFLLLEAQKPQAEQSVENLVNNK